MYHDEIIGEVWKNREALAKRHQHKLHEIVLAMQKRQQTPWSVLVDRRHRAGGRPECTAKRGNRNSRPSRRPANSG